MIGLVYDLRRYRTMSKIEQIIGEIEEYIAGCKLVPFSNTKIAVNKDEIEELIDELRLRTPDEIKKYQKLISNKDAILAEAKDKADKMIAEAQHHTEELISQHEIMQKACEQANAVIAEAEAKAQAIVDSATNDANAIRMGAISYTDEMLGNLQMLIEHMSNDTKSRYESLIGSFEKNLNIIAANRKELNVESEAQGNAPAVDEQTLAANVQEVMDDVEDND